MWLVLWTVEIILKDPGLASVSITFHEKNDNSFYFNILTKMILKNSNMMGAGSSYL
jgi:hypothetical protein